MASFATTVSAVFVLTVFVTAPDDASAWQETATTRFASKTKTFAPTSTSVIAEQEEFVQPYPDDSVVLLGEGYDLITGLRRPTYCVTAGPAQRVMFNDKNIFFSEVNDEESLLTKLNTSLSAKASYAGYSGGGSYKSSVETKTSTKDINIVAQADLKTFAETMKVPEAVLESSDHPVRRFDLTPEALKLLKKDPADFRRFCGDGYVSQITYGADFYAKFKYSEMSFEQKKSVEASANASGPAGVFSASASQSIDTEFKQKKINENIHAFERGGAPAPLPYDRTGLLKEYETFASRSENHERPLFITIRKYSALPSGRSQTFEVVSDNLDAMVQRVMRLRSLTDDFDDAIYQLEGGRDRGFVFFSKVETDERKDPAKVKDLRETLKTEVGDGRERIQQCLVEQTNDACQFKVDSSQSPSTSDDLPFRALAPVARNNFSDDEISGLNEYINLGGFLRDTAACNIVQTVQREHIEQISANRCRSGECIPGPEIETFRHMVYGGYDIQDTKCDTSNPPPAPVAPAATKGLGVVPIPKGSDVKMSSSVDAKGFNEFKATITCGNGQSIALGTFGVTSKFYPMLGMDCNLEIRADHGPPSTLYNGRPSGGPVPGKPGAFGYVLSYDDDTPGGIDFNDLVVYISILPHGS